jgi:hypothetical protein
MCGLHAWWVQALADVNRLLAPVSQVLAGIRWHHEPALSDGVGAYRSVTLNSSPVFIAERVVVAVKTLTIDHSFSGAGTGR